MRSVIYEGPGRLVVREVDDPVPAGGQALVDVVACGICGSDLHAVGSGYATRPGQVLGHEFAARVVDAPGVAGLAHGDRVVVRPIVPCGACAECAAGDLQRCSSPDAPILGFGAPGAFADRVLVPLAVTGQTVFPLPDHVSDGAATLTEPLAVAAHAVGMAGELRGGVALVLGAGMIGLGVVRFLRLAGARTIVAADPSPLRRERALALGADAAVDPLTDDPVARVRETTGAWAAGRGARADVVVDCAGAPGTLRSAIDACRQGGTIVVAAMGATKAEVRPDILAAKELVIRGSMAYRDEFPVALERLTDGSIDADLLVSHTFALDDIHEAFAVQRDANASVKVLVAP